MKRLFLLPLFVLVLSSCALVQRIALKNCEFRLAGTAIKEIALTYLKLGIIIDVTNPNPIDVVLDRMRFDLYINETKVANATSNLKTTIPSGASVKVTPIVTLDYAQVGAVIVSAIKNLSAKYKVIGTVYFDTPLGTFSFPVTIVKG